MSKKQKIIDSIKRLNPCNDRYIGHIEQCHTIKQAWESFSDGSDLIWLVAMFVDKQGSDWHWRVVLVACECARLSLMYAEEDDDSSRIAIETAEKLARNEEGVTLADVKKAAYAVRAVRADRAAHAAYYAAYSAAYSARSAAHAARSAAHAAGDAGDAGDYSAAKKATLKKCADIVRKEFTLKEVLEKYDKRK